MEHPFGQFGAAVPAMFPLNLLSIPILLAVGVGAVGETASVLCKHCSAVAKTPLCHQHPNYKHKAQRSEGCCGERGLHPSQYIRTGSGA